MAGFWYVVLFLVSSLAQFILYVTRFNDDDESFNLLCNVIIISLLLVIVVFLFVEIK